MEITLTNKTTYALLTGLLISNLCLHGQGLNNQGQMALDGQLAGTCSPQIDPQTNEFVLEDPVMAVFETDIVYPLGGAISPASFHNLTTETGSSGLATDQWTARNLGVVFGVELGDSPQPDLFVSTSNCYFGRGLASFADLDSTGVNATLTTPKWRGRVYRINGANGMIDDVVALNNDAGPSSVELGNLSFYKSASGQEFIYVSNFEDGLIYKLDAGNLSAVTTDTYDHGIDGLLNGDTNNDGIPDPQAQIADAGTDGSTTAIGRRIWGLKTFRDRLYYAVWVPGNDSDIWSVKLDGNGGFDTSDVDFHFSVSLGSAPVSSIDFRYDGLMFLAERGHSDLISSSPHSARVLEYQLDGTGIWQPEPVNKYAVSDFSTMRNAAGGVAVACDDLWYSANALGGVLYYGAQRTAIDDDGNVAALPDVYGEGLYFDFDGLLNNGTPGGYDKGQIGSVAVNLPCECAEINNLDVSFSGADSQLLAEFELLNISLDDAEWVTFIPDGGIDALCLNGESDPLGRVQIALDPPLASGDSVTVSNIEIKGLEAGEEGCIVVVLYDVDNEVCCTTRICVSAPSCFDYDLVEDSFEILGDNGDGTGTIRFCLDITNLVSYDFVQWQILGDILSYAEPFTPIAPGTTGEICFVLYNVPLNGPIGFTLVLHSEDYSECCSVDISFEASGGSGEPNPVECWDATLVPEEICCDPTGLATTSLILQNNSEEEKTFKVECIEEFNQSVECALIPCDAVRICDGPGTIIHSVVVPPMSSLTCEVVVNCSKLPDGPCGQLTILISGPDNTTRELLLIVQKDCEGLVAHSPDTVTVLDNVSAQQVTFQILNQASESQSFNLTLGDPTSIVAVDFAGNGSILPVTLEASESMTLTVDLLWDSNDPRTIKPFENLISVLKIMTIDETDPSASKVIGAIPFVFNQEVQSQIRFTSFTVDKSSVETAGAVKIDFELDSIVSKSVRVTESLDLKSWIPAAVGENQDVSADQYTVEAQPGSNTVYVKSTDSISACFYRLHTE